MKEQDNKTPFNNSDNIDDPIKNFENDDSPFSDIITRTGSDIAAIEKEINDARREAGEEFIYDLQGLADTLLGRFHAVQDQIENLNQDIRGYRDDALQKMLTPLIMDIIHAVDHIRQITGEYKKSDSTKFNVVKLLKDLETVPDTFDNLLYRHGITTFSSAKDELDNQTQSVRKTIDTENPKLDKKRAESLQPGYEWNNHILRPEIIAAYLHRNPNTKK